MNGFFFFIRFKPYVKRMSGTPTFLKNKKAASTGQPSYVVVAICLSDYNHNSENHYNGHSETSQRGDDQIPVNGVDLCSVDCFHSQV
jgi:hypothetical protein